MEESFDPPDLFFYPSSSEYDDSDYEEKISADLFSYPSSSHYYDDDYEENIYADLFSYSSSSHYDDDHEEKEDSSRVESSGGSKTRIDMDHNYKPRAQLLQQNRFTTLSTRPLPHPTRFINRSVNIFENSHSHSNYKEPITYKLADFPSLPSTSTPTENLIKPGAWFEKNSFHIITLENEHEELGFKEIFLKYLYTDFYYITTNPMKTKKWYEAILLVTKSIETLHVVQPDREKLGLKRLVYSKCKILQILSPSSWKAASLITPIAFPTTSNMKPSAYTYFDYIQAWENFLLIRPYTHSWFFQIKTNVSKPLPKWFLSWWDKYGITPNILPPDFFKKYDTFMKIPSKHSCLIEKQISFFFQHKFSWILVWQFCKTTDRFGQTELSRSTKIKWWNQYKEAKRDY